MLEDTKMEAETIAAIATSIGEASIGIVRVSGPASVKIARAVFRNIRGKSIVDFSPRKLIYGRFINPKSDEIIDEVLCVYMPAPHSYTCEDVCEFQTHGGTAVIRRVLSIVLECGARLAFPGEFTQRAFLNGRLDLSQAEAVMDIIRAQTDSARKNAQSQLSGELSQRIVQVRTDLLKFLARIEAALDYPEEDIDILNTIESEAFLRKCIDSIDQLLSTSQRGKILQDGLRTVIIGRPNVGKSSLLNALLREERALVTEIPGTTRDSIEEFLNLRGIPLRIVDTAGLHQSEDLVEQLGMQRTRDFLLNADLVLFLVDASSPITQEDLDIYYSLPSLPIIMVVNKIDLPQLIDSPEWSKMAKDYPVVSISTKDRSGFDILEQTIETLVFGGEALLSEPCCIVNIRHVECLARAREQIISATAALEALLPVDCIIIDLRAALNSLGQITGETVSEEIVREIFANFCLGK
jgi:tRNA modification GTPase